MGDQNQAIKGADSHKSIREAEGLIGGSLFAILLRLLLVRFLLRREVPSLGIGRALFGLVHDPSRFLLLLLFVDLGLFSVEQLLSGQYRDKKTKKALNRATKLAVPMGGFLGFVVYATSVGGYQAFFHQFDVSPDEIGLSQATIIAQAGSHLGSWLALVGIMTLSSLAIEHFFQRAAKHLEPGHWRGLEVCLGLAGAACLLLTRDLWFPWLRNQKPVAILIYHAGSDVSAFVFSTKGLLLFGIVIILIAILFIRGKKVRKAEIDVVRALIARPFIRGKRVRLRNARLEVKARLKAETDKAAGGARHLWIWLTAASILGFLIVAHIDALAEGTAAGQCAKDGGNIQSPLLGISVQRVRVKWRHPTWNRKYQGDDFLLLGENQFLILYDLVDKKTVQVLPHEVTAIFSASTSSITTVVPTAANCRNFTLTP